MSEELEKGIPKPICTGFVEFTEAEKEKNDIYFEKLLKEQGVLRVDETIKEKRRHP